MQEIECENCGWKGEDQDLVLNNELDLCCPECGDCRNLIPYENDGVSYDDYREQERGSSWK